MIGDCKERSLAMADEYIKLEDAIRICERLRDKNSENADMAFALNWAAESISRVPAADVQTVVHGRWIDERWRRNPFGSAIPYSCDAACSACGNHGDVRIKRGDEEWEINSPRCPVCGAFMDDETAIS